MSLASSSSRCFRPATSGRSGRQSNQRIASSRQLQPVRALPEALLFDCDGVSVLLQRNCPNLVCWQSPHRLLCPDIAPIVIWK